MLAVIVLVVLEARFNNVSKKLPFWSHVTNCRVASHADVLRVSSRVSSPTNVC